jgi:tryptophan synthase alpha chain
MPRRADGVTRLAAALERRRRAGQAALIPYLTAGFPALDILPTLVGEAFRAGADVVEVGVPFSDPLADGPTIQATATAALNRGFRLDRFWPVLTEAVPAEDPVVLLTYVNPVIAWGVDRFMADAAAAGVAGLIIPDLPWIEAAPFRRSAERRGLALIPLAAPTSTDAHLAAIRSARGFVYGVSVTGVTGVRRTLEEGVIAFAERLRRAVSLPVAIGFGISTPDQAQRVGEVADAVIVGSALMQAIAAQEEDAPTVVRGFVTAFRSALNDRTGKGGALGDLGLAGRREGR